METAISTISLIWVIGILTFQRIDLIVDEFVKAEAYYLSVNQGGILDLTQLSVKSLLPKTAIVNMVRKMSESEDRWDRKGLKESLFFYEISENWKKALELHLIILTLVLPAIYMIDFSKYSFLTPFDKSVVSLLSLFVFVIACLFGHKQLRYFSENFYPIRLKVTPEFNK